MKSITQQFRSSFVQLVPHNVREEGCAPLWSLLYLGFLFMNWSDKPTGIWLPPTLLSIVVFLLLFFSSLRRNGAAVLAHSAAMVALGLALVPLNTGANTYLIFAMASVPRAGVSLRDTLLAVAVTLAVYTGELWLLGWPWRYIALLVAVTGVVCTAVAAGNHHQREKRLRTAELKLSHEEVRRLAALAERERIGRDLHDLLGHTLSLITLKSELAVKLFDRDPMAARNEIVDVERVARDALGQVRRAVSGIRAAGLAAELASARLLLESSGVRLDYTLPAQSLPANIETVLALVVREAVTNIQRHAQATRAEVRLLIADDTAHLSIEDDGHGRAITPGNGLSGMRERLRALGGDLSIIATRGKGTVLEARIAAPDLDEAAIAPMTAIPQSW